VIELRSRAEIEQMRPAGAFVAEVLGELRRRTAVGVNLLDLDRIAHEMIRARGAESCYIDYHPSFGASPFGKVLCTSVNDAVLHGLPFDYRLRDGDMVSLDFAASVDGWVTDSALTVIVGTARPADERLLETTTRALAAGIAAVQAGGAWVTSPLRSAGLPGPRATGSTCSSAGTGWAARCTPSHTSPTTAWPGAARSCGRAS
jgi:methionyl aminopeptidase